MSAAGVGEPGSSGDVPPKVRALLTGLFDYAGLFPPAGLGMAETVRNFDAYRRGLHAWMLGRLIVPWGRRGEFLEALPARETPCPVSLLIPLPADAEAADRLRREHTEFAAAASGRVQFGAIETKVADAAALAGVGAAFDLLSELFPDAEIHAEAVGTCEVEALLDALVGQRDRTGRGAGKVRTGSVVPEEIPPVDEVGAFIRACAERDLPWKATAGLHHPLPATRPLTYEADAPRGPMHGYLGVIVAAARALDDRGTTAADLRALLADPDPRGVERVSLDAIHVARTRGCLSIGSCSFVEPVEGAENLGLLPNITESHR